MSFTALEEFVVSVVPEEEVLGFGGLGLENWGFGCDCDRWRGSCLLGEELCCSSLLSHSLRPLLFDTPTVMTGPVKAARIL